MERTKTLLVILFVVAAFAFVFLSVRPSTIADQSASGLLPDSQVRPAPDFVLPDAATGKLFQLQAQAKKHPIVLDFWATWCGPCRAELPHIEALSKRYAGRVGFYGLNSSDPPATIVAFSRQNGLTFPTLSDPQHKAAALYGADAIPLLIIVDTHGNVRAVSQGVDPNDPDMEKDLAKILDAVVAGR